MNSQHKPLLSQREIRGATSLLLNLEALDDRLELAQDLVGLLVVLDLGRD